jgi:serine/threonine protein kinase
LLLSEWDLCRRHGQHVELETYHGRFPERGQIITDLWHVWNERQSKSITTDPVNDTGPPRDRALLEQSWTVIDRYRLLEKVGEGGFGDVWAAEQREPVKRRVAL